MGRLSVINESGYVVPHEYGTHDPAGAEPVPQVAAHSAGQADGRMGNPPTQSVSAVPQVACGIPAPLFHSGGVCAESGRANALQQSSTPRTTKRRELFTHAPDELGEREEISSDATRHDAKGRRGRGNRDRVAIALDMRDASD